MSLPRVSQPAARARAPQRTGAATAVIMTGVLMTAVDTTIVVLAPVFQASAERVLGP